MIKLFLKRQFSSSTKRFDVKIDYYKALNLTYTASKDEIKKSYYKLALKYHPDTGGKSSEIRFKEISGAYAVIGNDELRQNYDQERQDQTQYEPDPRTRQSASSFKQKRRQQSNRSEDYFYSGSDQSFKEYQQNQTNSKKYSETYGDNYKFNNFYKRSQKQHDEADARYEKLKQQQAYKQRMREHAEKNEYSYSDEQAKREETLNQKMNQNRDKARKNAKQKFQSKDKDFFENRNQWSYHDDNQYTDQREYDYEYVRERTPFSIWAQRLIETHIGDQNDFQIFFNKMIKGACYFFGIYFIWNIYLRFTTRGRVHQHVANSNTDEDTYMRAQRKIKAYQMNGNIITPEQEKQIYNEIKMQRYSYSRPSSQPYDQEFKKQ